MIYKAYSPLTQKLLTLPETGMGYQIIRAQPFGPFNTTNTFIVYNAELIVELDTSFQNNKRKILNEGYDKIISEVGYINLGFIRVIKSRELKDGKILSESKKDQKGRHSGGSGAIDNPPISGNGEDIFVRLSAYEKDKRVDFINKRLVDGSYTTTFADYITCKTHNDNPVDRYSLPNDEDVKWAFHFKPKRHDKYRPGIVQPANGHSGGGIEALFDKGTSFNTFLKKTHY